MADWANENFYTHKAAQGWLIVPSYFDGFLKCRFSHPSGLLCLWVCWKPLSVTPIRRSLQKLSFFKYSSSTLMVEFINSFRFLARLVGTIQEHSLYNKRGCFLQINHRRVTFIKQTFLCWNFKMCQRIANTTHEYMEEPRTQLFQKCLVIIFCLQWLAKLTVILFPFSSAFQEPLAYQAFLLKSLFSRAPLWTYCCVKSIVRISLEWKSNDTRDFGRAPLWG